MPVRVQPLFAVALSLLFCCSLARAPQADVGWDVTQPRGRAREIRFTTDEATWLSVDASPDGRTLVFDLVGDLWLLPIAGGEAKPITRDSGIALNFHPRFSPDGKRIAFVSDRSGAENVWVVDADGKNPRQVSRQREDRMAMPTWTPDGRYIIVRRGGDANNMIDRGLRIRGRGDLWMYDGDSGEGIQLTPDDISASWPSVSPDGRYVYFEEVLRGRRPDYLWSTVIDIEDPAKGRYQIRRLDRQTGEVLEITAGSQEAKDGGGGQLSSGGACAPEISPDGRWLAFVRRVADGTAFYRGHEYGPRTALWLRDLKAGAERLLLDPIIPDAQGKNDIGPVPRYAWTPDGDSLVVTADGKLVRVYVEDGHVEEIPFTAQVVKRISEKIYFTYPSTDGPLSVRSVRWPALSPDERWLAFQAVGRIWLMQMPNGQPRRLTAASFAPHEYAPAWSPDGQWLAFTTWSDDEGGHVWKVRAGEGSPVRLTVEPAEYMNPTWSPDGEKIVLVRGSGATARGRMPAENEWYELRWLSASGGETDFIAVVRKRPSSAHTVEPVFGPEGRLFYLEHKSEDGHAFTELVSIRLDGLDKRRHLRFRFADQAAPSPDGVWVAFQEADNIYLTSLPWPGAGSEPTLIDRRNPRLSLRQLSHEGGNFPRWINSETLSWGSANRFFTFTTRSATIQAIEVRLEVPRRIAAGTVALLGARIITMAGDQTIEAGDLVVRNGRIVAIGPSGRVPIPAHANRIDLRGKTIIPGLIDVHDHLHGYSDAFIPQRDWELAANLAYGITTARDPSAWPQNVFTVAELVEAGEMIGPRIFSTGPSLRGLDAARADRIENPDDARRLVRRLASYGATAIKEYQQPRREQRQMSVEAAREAGLNVTCEGDGSPLYHLALAMDGYTGSEHPILAGPLYRDVTEFLGQAGIFYDVTLMSSGIRPRGEDYFYQESDIWKDRTLRHFTPWRKLEVHTRHRVLRPATDFPFPLIAQGLADIIAAGGHGALGAHGQKPGIGSHFELWAIASAMPPLQALRVATLHGAMFLGVQQDVGSLEVGKLADLVVLDANPLEDIRNTNTIRYVMKAGILYDGDSLDEVWPERRPYGEFYWRQKGVRPEPN